MPLPTPAPRPSPNAPIVDVELDRPRRLRLDLGALCRVEDVTGTNMLNLQSLTVPSANQLRALVWAGCLWEDDTISLVDVDTWIGAENFVEVRLAVQAALRKSMPEPDVPNAGAPAGEALTAETGPQLTIVP